MLCELQPTAPLLSRIWKHIGLLDVPYDNDLKQAEAPALATFLIFW